MQLSHVAENERIVLAPLVNTQKTSYRQNAQGYDTPPRVDQTLRRCQNLFKWGNVPSAIRKAARARHRGHRSYKRASPREVASPRERALPRESVAKVEGITIVKCFKASSIPVSTAPPPRYPQVGKTVEGDEIEGVKANH